MPPTKFSAKINPEVEKCIFNLEKCFKIELKHKSPVYGYDGIVRRISHALNLNERAVYRVLEKQNGKVSHSKRKKKKMLQRRPRDQQQNWTTSACAY